MNLNQYGFLTQSTYHAGGAIFIFVGILKVAFGLLGILVMFLPKKPIIAVVSALKELHKTSTYIQDVAFTRNRVLCFNVPPTSVFQVTHL